MPIPLQTLAALAALAGHVVLWVGFVNRIHGVGWPRRLVDGLTALAGVALVGVPAWGAVILAQGARSAPWWGAPRPLLAYGAAALAVGACAALHALWLRSHPERRSGVRVTSRRTHMLAEGDRQAFAPGPARWIGRLPGNQVLALSVEELEAPIPGLPAGLDGLRIAHVTDTHLSGRIARRVFEELAEVTNQGAPDLILLTGDLVEFDRCLPWVAPVFGRLRAPLGAWFILGNHDRHCDTQRLRGLLSDAGLHDVSGRNASVERHGAEVLLSGNEAPWGPEPPPAPPADPARPRLVIGLAHTPDLFGWAQRRGCGLLLAGHNHGGQVRFPLLGALLTPSVHGTRYAQGSFRAGGTLMHVSRGACSLAPMRWLCPPELGFITLRAAPSK